MGKAETKSPLSRGYPILALITVLLMVWHHFGMNTTLVVFPSSDTTISLYMDDINDGVSKATLEQSDTLITFQCNIQAVARTHAFCGIEMLFQAPLDVTGFEYLNIDIDTDKSQRDTTLLYLINYEPDSGKASEERANMRTIFVEDNATSFALPIRSFSVPSWWLLDNPTDSMKGEPNLGYVTKIRITSGDSTFTRSERITINRIAFSGKYLPTNLLYLLLLSAWVLLSTYYAILFLKNMKDESLTIQKRSEQLKEINRFLKLEKSKYKKMAVTDPLTHALNRAGISRVFDTVLGAWLNNKQVSVLIIMDLDDFKRVNDENGHDVGDQVLKDFVEVINHNIRSTDYLARWGGEEFALICSNDDIESARLLAEKLRKAVQNHAFSVGHVTCSFGISKIQNNIEVWVKQADLALYESKRLGKNQVVVAH